jgi:hypothetical protein
MYKIEIRPGDSVSGLFLERMLAFRCNSAINATFPHCFTQRPLFSFTCDLVS